MSEKKPNCRTCVHRLSVPGSAHSRCNVGPTAKVVGNLMGVKRGWFRWPMDYDPVCLQECDSWTDEESDRKPRVQYDPLTEIFGMLR